MKKAISYLVFCVLLNAFPLKTKAATLPFLPAKNDFAGSTVTNLNSFIPDVGDYTLEVQATIGVTIDIAFSGISYTPTESGVVRFVQLGSKVYVFENCAYKAVFTANPQYTTTGNNLIANPSFETATLFDGVTDRWLPNVWETWDGGASTWGSDVGKTNVRENSAYCSDGVKSLIMHSVSRYLMQGLSENALSPNASYLLTYDYWTSSGAGNGGVTYQLLFGSERSSGSIVALQGHTTIDNTTAKYSFSTVFQTPSSVPSSVWFSLYRNIDKVDWLDNFKLVRINPTNAGITGTTSATYLPGTAYYPENITFSNGDYISSTSKLVNPDFESDLTGWNTVNGSKISTAEKANGLIAATQKHCQIYVTGGVTGNFYQTVTGLPNGKYSLTAAVSPYFAGGTAKLFANAGTTSIISGTGTTYEVFGVVYDGTLQLGLQLATTGSSTIDFDAFNLKYVGVDVDSYLQLLAAKITKAKTDTVAMKVAGNSGYNNIEQYRTVLAEVTNLPDSSIVTVLDAIKKIDTALNEYTAIQAAYTPLKTAISELTTQLAASTYPDKTAFNATISAAQSVYDSKTDQRSVIPQTLASITYSKSTLSLYSQLSQAVMNSNQMYVTTNYAGKSVFLMAITEARAVYNEPVGKDLDAAIKALAKARLDYYNSQYTIAPIPQVISYVDTNVAGSEKFVLRVGGKPYYMANVQVRLDKLKGNCGFTTPASRDSVIKRAALDGFNTVGIPIHWREVEPVKDMFDWTILDEYMGLCKKYGIKMEMLWFSWSSGGRVQWLDANNLRTPDYVCSLNGTSEFNMLHKSWEYSLDWRDTKLRDREKYVLSQIMEHIALWDANNNNPSTVIGVQLGNEARGHYENTATAAEIINYYSAVGAAVKESKYVTWTRLNCVSYETTGRTSANETKRNSGGTNIDFVGVDIYGTSASGIKGNVSGYLGATGKNYLMIMESGAEVSAAGIYQMAALSGDKAYSHYDFAGVDGHDLYSRNGLTLVAKSHVQSVRNVNKVMNLDNADIALKKQGTGLYVYNYAGSSTVAETGIESIVFTPASTTSQAIAVRRSSSELVLMTTGGGAFTYPSTTNVLSASKGYFDSNDVWVNQGDVSFTSTSITVPSTTAVRLIVKTTDEKVTGLIQNPSFEKVTTIANAAGYKVPMNWTLDAAISGADVQLKNYEAQDGVYRYYMAGTVSNIDFYQDVTLPAGQYTVKTSLKPATPSATNLYVTVNGKTTKTIATGSWSAWGTVPVTFTVPVAGATVRIGVQSTAAVIIDNFQMTRSTTYVPTDIPEVFRNNNFRVSNCEGGVRVTFDDETTLPDNLIIFSLSGQMIKQINTASREMFIPLVKGVYIINSKKVIVY